MKRCAWVRPGNLHYENYHDLEWGVPVHDDEKHFEMIILEGAQAGLSWETILKRRQNYAQAFHDFNPKKVAAMSEPELLSLMDDSGIIRNRLKIFSARKNALAFLAIQREFVTFDAYVWNFVGGSPIINRPKTSKDVPTRTHQSDALSKDLKKRGMSFVGSTIIYAYMQAIGMVNDHTADCFKALQERFIK